MNLYKMGQKIIEEKRKFLAAYDGKFESQYNKNKRDQWEEYIIEEQDEYIKMCNLYNDEPSQAVLSWNF